MKNLPCKLHLSLLLLCWLSLPSIWAQTSNPQAICQDITVQLDAAGEVQIAASDVDGGSTNFTSMSLSPQSFDCAAVGKLQSWQVVGTPNFDGVYYRMAVGPDGTPYVIHSDRSASNKTSVRKWDGTNWQLVGGAGISSNRSWHNRIAIAADGTVYITYSDDRDLAKIFIRRWTGSIWENLNGTGFEAEAATHQNFAVAPDGTPYIVYRDENTAETLIRRWVNNSWQHLGVLTLPGTTITDPSLAIDAQGTPYIAYREIGGPHHLKTSVQKWNGSSWQVVGAAGISAGSATGQRLVISPAGVPYVSYVDAQNGSKLTVLQWNGSAWQALGGVGISAGSIAGHNLTISPSGHVYVSYSESSVLLPRVIKWINGAWQSVGGTYASSVQAGFIHSAIAPDGIPYMLYRNSSCLLYTSPSPRDRTRSRMPSSA